MNKITGFLVLVFLLAANRSQAQCEVLDEFSEGTTWEYTNYDKKGKETGKVIQKIVSLEKKTDGFEAVVSVEIKEKKGDDLPPMEMKMGCRNGVFYMDMKNLIPKEYLTGEDGETTVTVDGDQLAYPVGMKPGDLLPEATVKVNIGGMINMTLRIFNRKVEGAETLTTPAGTFDCLVISESSEVKMMITARSDSKQWYVPGIGSVRTESYRKGKLMGYTLLTAFGK